MGTFCLIVGLAYSLSPWANAALALVAGVVLASLFGNPYQSKTKVFAHKLLAYSVAGLGAGMNLLMVARVGLHGLGYTVVSITGTLLLGIGLGRLLKNEQETSTLISVGTAICGGSAIAAVAPVIRAKSHSMTVSLGTVFLLNAVALMVFPMIGHFLHLSQTQFGLWSALAIHDTSSVVGATMQYGTEALNVGTTVKLARALWIVPVTILFSFLHKKDTSERAAVKQPWFILGFLIMAALSTWLPFGHGVFAVIEVWARKLLVATLFLIGFNLDQSTIRQVGLKPIFQGVALWLIVLSVTLVFVEFQ